MDHADADGQAGASFQERVQPWMAACFGEEISADRTERNHRFLEEALELAQANRCTRSEAIQLVDYVFGRPVGEVRQEIGGVMVTLAALCLALGEDMHAAGDVELARVWTKVEAIRAKQAAKPKHSPLPQHVDVKDSLEVESAFKAGYEAAFEYYANDDNERGRAYMDGFRAREWNRYREIIGIRQKSPEWRCFHCDETFMDVETAKAHFGDSEICTPACCMKPEDIREMERELERYRLEDSDKDREFYAMRADHVRALRVEEEKGYEKGLRDGEALLGEPYAWEFGKSNGDGTFSVVIERSRPARAAPDWPVKPLYAREPEMERSVIMARFGHRRDPAEDFAEEVAGIERQVKGLLDAVDRHLLSSVGDRVFRAMSFKAGAVEIAVVAKDRLRKLEKDLALLGYGAAQ